MIAPQIRKIFNNASHASMEISLALRKAFSSSTLAAQHSRTPGIFSAFSAPAGDFSGMPSRQNL